MTTVNQMQQKGRKEKASEVQLSVKARAFCILYGVDTDQLRNGIVVMNRRWPDHMHPPDILTLLGLPLTAPIVLLPTPSLEDPTEG